jgi:hypothetical protein
MENNLPRADCSTRKTSKEVKVAKTNRKKTNAQQPKRKTSAEQQKLLQALGPKLQQRVKRVSDWFKKSDLTTLKERHALGREVRALSEAKEDNGTGHYGRRFIANLCMTFGWDRGVVYGALATARAFTEEEITALSDRPMPNGRLLSCGHLRVLSKVPAPKERGSLLDKAIAHGWTREELADAILRATGKRKGDGRGRPPKPPKDLRGLLLQQEHSAEAFVQRTAKVWEKQGNTLLAKVKKLPAKEVTEEQIAKLRGHAAILRQLVTKAGEQAAEAERAADYLLKKLTAPNGPEAEEASAGAASDGSNEEEPPSDKS